MRAFFHDGCDPTSRLKSLFDSTAKTLAKAGPAKRRKRLRVHEVIEAWQRDRATLSANDIYFRNEKLDRAFNCDAISDFNVLPTSPPSINHLEVATLLMGTAGCMTDAHSDDPDGCNHCVIGRKLWLVWDRIEGQKNGLEDCEYNKVYTQARFSLKAFLQLQSARWFTVSKGQTLFLPGNLTHKVITLERYLGISSFYVGLPNVLSSVTRWRLNGTIMVGDQDKNEIIELILRQLERTAAGDRQLKHRWGFYHLEEALSYWEQKYTPVQREELKADPYFRKLVERISAHCR
jgi:hypothetical protein